MEGNYKCNCGDFHEAGTKCMKIASPVQRGVILPSWKEVRSKLEKNEYVNPVEDFIINYSPLDEERAETFRLLLQNAIIYIKAR